MTKKLLLPLVPVLLACPALAEKPQVNETKKPPSPQKESIHREKLADDPTKVVTKLGIGYTDQFSLSASLGLDEIHKINGRISEDASDWRIGGSWLFKLGIVNVSFGKTEYDHGGSQNKYSIGTFVPLTVFGFSPMGWQIFPTAGYSHNDGDIAVENEAPDMDSDWVMTPSTSNGGYLGGFALKPLTEHWNLMTFGGGSLGSDNYSGYWLGGGAGCKINAHHSFNVFAFASDNSYGAEEKIGASYTYQFK
ncbi:MAG: hypothetical protein ABFR63_05170 [Thermodesulfobacteriota bacterium]